MNEGWQWLISGCGRAVNFYWSYRCVFVRLLWLLRFAVPSRLSERVAAMGWESGLPLSPAATPFRYELTPLVDAVLAALLLFLLLEPTVCPGASRAVSYTHLTLPTIYSV